MENGTGEAHPAHDHAHAHASAVSNLYDPLGHLEGQAIGVKKRYHESRR